MLVLGDGPLVLTEMLPLPEGSVVSSFRQSSWSSWGLPEPDNSSEMANDEMTTITKGEVRAAEFVLEFSAF